MNDDDPAYGTNHCHGTNDGDRANYGDRTNYDRRAGVDDDDDGAMPDDYGWWQKDRSHQRNRGYGNADMNVDA